MAVGVYELIGPDGRRYVGSSTRSVENRLSYHKSSLSSGRHYNANLQRLYDEVGWEGIRVKITECEEPLVIEQRKLDYWSARGKLLNVNPRADNSTGRKLTRAQREKCSTAATARCTPEWREEVSKRVKDQHAKGKFGRATWTEETARAQASKMRGKANVMKGKHYGPEHGEKISAKLKGKPKSEAHRLAARKARWGY